MKRTLSFSLACFTCVCLLLATDRRACAYVDPGQGLIALQSLGAALAAAAYFLRRQIRTIFGGKKQDESLPLPIVAKEDASRKAA